MMLFVNLYAMHDITIDIDNCVSLSNMIHKKFVRTVRNGTKVCSPKKRCRVVDTHSSRQQKHNSGATPDWKLHMSFKHERASKHQNRWRAYASAEKSCALIGWWPGSLSVWYKSKRKFLLSASYKFISALIALNFVFRA